MRFTKTFPRDLQAKTGPCDFQWNYALVNFSLSLEMSDIFFSSKLVETYIFRWTTQILIASSVNFDRISHADRYEVKFSHDQCGKRVKIIRSETRPNDKYERLMTLKNLVILKYYALWTICPKYYPKYITIIRFIAGRKYGKFRKLL